MGNIPSACRRKSKSAVVLSGVNSVYLDKIYEIIKPKQNPEVIERNSRGELPRGFKDVDPFPEDVFSQLLVNVFNGKEDPLSIMRYFPLRNFLFGEINLSITADRDDIIFKTPKIAGGSYGSIYLSKYFPDPNYPKLCVGKKTEYRPKATENDKNFANSSFIEEMLTSILLYEITEKKVIPQVFPKIIGCYNTNGGLVMQMEKLDMTLYEFLREFNRTEKIEMLIIIAHCINLLQKNYDFVHGDLHPGNIMLKNERFSIEISGIKIQSNYRPYFIDLGMVCVDLSTCCGLTDMRVKGGAYADPNYCNNKSQDLRLLLYSLWNHGGQTPLDLLIKKLFEDNSNDEKYKQLFFNYKDDERPPSHALYQDVANLYDSNFYPENVITQLLPFIP
jgi:tRNA A-37 threonylcarbamoyl transferase component Bud32